MSCQRLFRVIVKISNFFSSLPCLTENMKYHGIIPSQATVESSLNWIQERFKITLQLHFIDSSPVFVLNNAPPMDLELKEKVSWLDSETFLLESSADIRQVYNFLKRNPGSAKFIYKKYKPLQPTIRERAILKILSI